MNNKEDAYEISLACISAENNTGYWESAIPSARDSEISSMLDAWVAATEARRKAIASQLCLENADMLLAYSERMAALAVRLDSEEPIVHGLVALGMAWGHTDDREIYCILPLHYNSVRVIRQDPVAVFKAATAKCAPECRQAIMGFPNRSEQDRSLAAMGYVESEDEGGFRYRRTW